MLSDLEQEIETIASQRNNEVFSIIMDRLNKRYVIDPDTFEPICVHMAAMRSLQKEESGVDLLRGRKNRYERWRKAKVIRMMRYRLVMFNPCRKCYLCKSLLADRPLGAWEFD